MTDEGRSTILLVEDEVLISRAEGLDLEKSGYDVLVAPSGERAVELAMAGGRIDLVLMDIDLGPGIDGADAAAAILGGRELPIIFLSSHAEAEIARKVEGIASYGYITKGSGKAVLATSIKMALKLFEANSRIKTELAERRRIEEELRESELRYRSLFESMGQGFYIAEIVRDEGGSPVDFRYLDVNPAFERIVGLGRDGIVGRTYNELVPPDPASGWLECFKRVASTGIAESYTFPSAIYKTYFETYAFRPEEGKFAALVKDITDRIEMEKRIEGLLLEKEVILKEVHHRIKNDMSIVSGLLSLQAGAQADTAARDALAGAADRMRSMEVLYEKLYEAKDGAAISLREYLSGLIGEIGEVFADRREIRIVADLCDIALAPKILSPIGIVVNELVTNAMKHAFVGRGGGTIDIAAESSGGLVRIRVEDDGIGLPEAATAGGSEGFGMQLIRMLADQLGGKIDVSRGGGTRFSLEFRP
jgi:PAS domain S-box-containing protein